MDLSIITVTWNSEGLIADQIRSVRGGCKNIAFEQIVADNASSDRTVEIIEKDFPEVQLIQEIKNTGFGFPNNKAAKLAKGNYLLFLNPDMRAQDGGLDAMVNWMDDHPEAGLASCRLIDEDGQFNNEAKPRRYPTVLNQLAVILKIPHFFPNVLDKYLYKDFDSNREQEVDSVRGSFMMARRAIYEKLGWIFDPRYFIWFEDVDICREARRLGYKVMYTPVINCVDYVGQSFKQRTTLWKQRQFTKSMLQYFKKWEPWYKWIWIAIFRPVGLAMAWVNDIAHSLQIKKSS